jgi:hypothetical protein
MAEFHKDPRRRPHVKASFLYANFLGFGDELKLALRARDCRGDRGNQKQRDKKKNAAAWLFHRILGGE